MMATVVRPYCNRVARISNGTGNGLGIAAADRIDTRLETCSSSSVLKFTHIGDVTSDEVERLRTVYQPLADSVRELVDATIRTEVDAAEVASIKAEIDAATARLRAQQIDGPFGVQYTTGGERMSWGNPVIGIRTRSRRRS